MNKPMLVRSPDGQGKRLVPLKSLNEAWVGGRGEGVPDAWNMIQHLRNRVSRIRKVADDLDNGPEEIAEAALEAFDYGSAERMADMTQALWHLCTDLKKHALFMGEKVEALLRRADGTDPEFWGHDVGIVGELEDLRRAHLGERP